MIPVLYDAEATSFVKNGIARLNDCISCLVTEERNGLFEVEFEYPLTGIHYADIQLGRIISCAHDETGARQPFRIYRRSAPIDGVVTFNAHHIAYDLQNVILEPYTASSCTLALAGFTTHALTDCPFTFWTDKSVSGTFTVTHPTSIWDVLGGSEGSILDVFGTGEWEFDGWTVKLYLNRGANNGVVVRYGKNLTDLTHEVETDGTYNAILPYWMGADDAIVIGTIQRNNGLIHQAYWTDQNDLKIEDENGNYFEFGYYSSQVVPMDFSGQFQEQPTRSQLNSAASAFLTNNTPWLPHENLTFDFVALWQTEEYASYAFLQRVKLCDTLRVVYSDLGVDTTAKVVRVVYNALLDRYDEIEIGDPKTTYAGLIERQAVEESSVNTQEAIRATYSTFEDDMNAAIQNATELITGGLGGHVVFGMDANGKPQEIYIMDTEDVQTATKVFRMNVNGMGFSTNGINGTYRTAWTFSNAAFVADFITAGTLTANLLKAGTIQGTGDNNYWDLVSGVLSAQTGYIGDFSISSGMLSYNNGTYSYTIGQNYGFSAGLYNSAGPYWLYVRLYRDRLRFSNNINNYIGYIMGTLSGGITINSDTSYISLGSADSTYVNYGLLKEAADKEIDLQVGTSDGGGINYMYMSIASGVSYIMSGQEFLISNANFRVALGTKSRSIQTKDFAERDLYCYETPSPMFGDVGEGEIDEDGSCHVWLDPVFSETIQTTQYQVFLQAYGDGRCYVAERNPTHFVVKGTAGMAFGWEIKSKQIDYPNHRLEVVQPTLDKNEFNYVKDAQHYIDEIYEERGLSECLNQ